VIGLLQTEHHAPKGSSHFTQATRLFLCYINSACFSITLKVKKRSYFLHLKKLHF